jgi:hypothetical protein
MFRNALLLLLFTICSSSLLHGGGTISRPSNEESSNSEITTIIIDPYESPQEESSNIEKYSTVKPYESIQKELHDYLEGLNLDNINNKLELRKYLLAAVNRDIRDTKKFPVFTAFRKRLKPIRDEKKARELDAAVGETIDKFIDAKLYEYKEIDKK